MQAANPPHYNIFGMAPLHWQVTLLMPPVGCATALFEDLLVRHAHDVLVSGRFAVYNHHFAEETVEIVKFCT